MAISVGSEGCRARLEGVKETQALEWGARFCVPRRMLGGVCGVSVEGIPEGGDMAWK